MPGATVKHQSSNAVVIESAIASSHLGSSVCWTPAGHFAVVECTTGLLKADSKMARVVERAERVKAQVQGSGLRVLPVMVTSKTRAEVKADLEEAERHGVLVITSENLQEAVEVRTLPLPNANAIYDEAERAVQDLQARYVAEPELDLG